MCVIAVSPVGKKVAREVFERMWRSNDDGFGMMYRTREGVAVVKGILNEEEAWETYSQLPEGVPHVLHFRLATHGGVKPELTHPFVVSEDSPLVQAGVSERPVLAHNGVWSLHALKQKEVRLEGPVSDTRVLAAWLGRMAKDRPIGEVLAKHYYEVLSAGRVVVVDPATWKLHLVGHWVREGNLLFSNHSFRENLYALSKGVCDWKWSAKMDWPVVLAKEKAKMAEPLDLEAVAPPEAQPAEIDEVEPTPDAEPVFAWTRKAAPRVKGNTGLAVLRRSLWAVAAEIGEDAVDAVRCMELDDYGDCLAANGVAGLLEVEDEGYMWRVRLWNGTRTREARSRFLVVNEVLLEFVRREAAVLRFLEAAGIYDTAQITSYDDVFGYFVDENGMFVGDLGEMTPEEAAEWYLWDMGAGGGT
jgi:predicted glutamine amidotransferase